MPLRRRAHRRGARRPAANITAIYRIGLGLEGDAAAGRLTRIKRAHPLLDHVVNLTAGDRRRRAGRAGAVRSQATRWIRTFDRAVSVADLADLALTMPGIARARPGWDQVRGPVLVVATADGEPPPALAPVRAFLDARRDTSVPLRFVAPAPRDVQLSVLRHDPIPRTWSRR